MNLDYKQNNYIDFTAIENQLGFKIHPDLKEFYLRNLIGESLEINIDKKYLENSTNHKNWFNEIERVYLILNTNGDLEKFPSEFISNFDQDVIYGKEKLSVKRYILGNLFDDRGQMSILFNNDNGHVEWCDFEYGADKWEENPRGVIATNMQEFVKMLNLG